MNETIYLVDGSAYIYRAYHAIAPLTSRSGIPTNATLGFVNMINRLRKDKDPQFLAIAFDSKGPVFRHELYKEYKANRPPMPADLVPQLQYIKEFVRAANIALFELPGVEADDIIATATQRFVDLGHKVVIVSGDKDLLQLVNDSVTMWDPMRDKLMDDTEVMKKYGVTPSQLLDFFALIGDSSDNVPGVAGVGPKTAEKLINEFRTLDGLYENVEGLKASKMKERLIESKEMAYLSKELIKLKSDVEIPIELPSFAVRAGNDSALAKLYQELDFVSLLKSVDVAEKIPTSGFVVVRTAEKLRTVVAELNQAAEIVLDTETTSLTARKAQLVGISLCTSLDTAYYLPVGHLDGDGAEVPEQLSGEQVKQALLPILCDAGKTIVGHNLKYDLTVLQQQWGQKITGRLADTMIAAYLTESGGSSLKLDTLCMERGLRLTSFAEVVGKDTRDNSFAYVDVEAAAAYSCEDVYGTLVLWQEFQGLLADHGQESLFYDIEMAVLPILVEMECKGICIDSATLQRLSGEFSNELSQTAEHIYRLAGHEFNINSPRQLGQVLFEELGLPHGRKTKTGYSTDVKVLERLAGKHELVANVLRFRTLTKLLSTYVEKLMQLQDPDTGRVHTSFNQAVAATGRLSSSDPNLQNIPIRTEEGGRIRAAFVPAKELVFLSADYSQIDLRVLAHYSQDEALLRAFRAGEDIHARTAAEIFAVSPLLVNAEMRRVAKSINFGIVYGMSAFGLSSQLDIGRKEAQRFIDRYFNLYKGVKVFMETIVAEARRQGYVSTLLNRRRRVIDIDAKNRVKREFAERLAINTPIQGTAADIIKLAMISCQKALADNGLQAAMLLQIHDELVFELPPDEVEATRKVIKEAMENAYPLAVPLTVNLEVGNNLAK